MMAEYGTKVILKASAAAGGLGTGVAFLAQETIGKHPLLQYGAIGILGLCAFYIISKIVPMVIESRRNETDAFISVLTSEREKLVQSMERLSEAHVTEVSTMRNDTEKLLREFNDTAAKERETWAALMKESNTIAGQNTALLSEVSCTLKDIKQQNENG